MPALLELQRAMGRALLAPSAPDAQTLGFEASPAFRFYRNTCLGSLTQALALSFPAVRRLVGSAFFETAAQAFIRAHPATSACLNDYGEQLPAFLAHYRHAAAVAYLPDVARLEWAVNRALHAADVKALDVASLAQLDAAAVPALTFAPHPAVTVLRLERPADAIWRAVLDGDDAAMAALDPNAGPVWLLIDRSAEGVEVRRMQPPAGVFTQRLCAGEPLQAALDAAAASAEPTGGESMADALKAVLADHLASARFTRWRIGDQAS
ncbi:MAG: putative DNA-binding domain-containing protein [Steroidobacterales bacterium]